MTKIRWVVLCVALLAFCQSAKTASSPDNREPTDPNSIVSGTNGAARPVPIEDLYYTRNVAGASWSPDGRFVAFITDMSGRLNLWKVNSAGGWPLQ